MSVMMAEAVVEHATPEAGCTPNTTATATETAIKLPIKNGFHRFHGFNCND